MINFFMKDPVTITRAGTGSFNTATGYFTAASTTTIAALASVQPASGRDLLLLPEGQRTKDVMKIYLREEIKTVDNNLNLSDKITYKGRTYQVHQVGDWFIGDVKHFKGIIIRDE